MRSHTLQPQPLKHPYTTTVLTMNPSSADNKHDNGVTKDAVTAADAVGVGFGGFLGTMEHHGDDFQSI